MAKQSGQASSLHTRPTISQATATEDSQAEESKLPDPASARLELGPHQRNVFVTQLNQAEEEDLVREVPVVSETGARLLDTGVNTLQKTLVLKKEAELSKIDSDLLQKRREFQDRMRECESKKIVLAEKQQAMKDRVGKFEKFIQENEAKRRRAIQRYQTESRLRAFKEREEEELQSYLALLRRKQAVLSAKVQAYRKFETYMTSVVDILPPDYIKVSDNVIGGLIMRYNTLEDTFNRLYAQMSSVQEQIQETRDRESRLKADHARDVLSKNSQLAELHEATERQKGTQEQHEQQVSYVIQRIRDRSEAYGMTLRAIDNVATRCLKRHDPHLQSLDWPEKMEKIRDHLMDMEEVVRAVQDQMARGVTPSATPAAPAAAAK
uniref:DUF4200 domain-containing protein n=1 Tax=Macrostomum lignano TaxID=282301 RepID=A0A1I8HVF3_9PLAT